MCPLCEKEKLPNHRVETMELLVCHVTCHYMESLYLYSLCNSNRDHQYLMKEFQEKDKHHCYGQGKEFQILEVPANYTCKEAEVILQEQYSALKLAKLTIATHPAEWIKFRSR